MKKVLEISQVAGKGVGEKKREEISHSSCYSEIVGRIAPSPGMWSRFTEPTTRLSVSRLQQVWLQKEDSWVSASQSPPADK